MAILSWSLGVVRLKILVDYLELSYLILVGI